MDDNKKFKGMSRTDLIKQICECEKDLSDLRFEYEELKKSIDEKSPEQAGSIADTAAKITDIFSVAQRTADEYITRVKNLTEKQTTDLNRKRLCIEDEVRKTQETAKVEAEITISNAKEEAARIIKAAEEEANKKWRGVREQLQEFLDAHKGLRELLKSTDVDVNKLI